MKDATHYQLKTNEPDNQEKNQENNNDTKILLALMPYWTPQIPPMGIACIKSYLNQHGYPHVKGVDANTEISIRSGYDCYFQRLREVIPPGRQGNFRSIGNVVWQNHMMAHLNYEDENEYIKLIKMLIKKVFFTEIETEVILEFNKMITQYYRELEDYIIALLEKEKPDFFGVSAFIGTLPASLFALKLTRQRFPHIRTVLGGGVFYDQLGQGSPNLDEFINKTTDYIDHIVIGEGEILFLKLVQGKIPMSKRILTAKDIEGELVQLNTVQPPDISDFNLLHYPTIGAYASRSCPFQCRFCSDPVFWGKYRKKGASQVVEEFTNTYKEKGYQLFILTDLLMNPMVKELSTEFLKSPVSIYWDCPMRICDEAADIENTLMWRRAGYYRVEMGCESGSPRVLKLMDKRITVDQIRKALTSIAYSGIKTTTYWVIGYPGETEEDFQMTLDLVEELKDYIYEAMNNAFWYFPGGPVNNVNWKDKGRPLFPDWAKDMLILQEWNLDVEPGREERYDRVNRFVRHIKKLGIPDINSLQDIYEADERWKKLHKNAVPAMIEFERGKYIDENKFIKETSAIQNTLVDDGDWGF